MVRGAGQAQPLQAHPRVGTRVHPLSDEQLRGVPARASSTGASLNAPPAVARLAGSSATRAVWGTTARHRLVGRLCSPSATLC
jgi:hypothetical protein